MIKKFLTIAMISGIISGCSALSAVSSLFGGSDGTNVNANAQIGKENTQQIVGKQEVIKGENVTVSKVDGGSTLDVKEIGAMHQTIQNIPPWVLLLLVLGWVLPTPMTIFFGILRFFNIKKD